MGRHRTDRAASRMPKLGPKYSRYLVDTRFDGVGEVPDGPVRAHVLMLNSLGLPFASIARDAGVSNGTVLGLIHGRQYLRSRIAAAIMAVSHLPNERQQMVLAVGALRRLRALSAIGWSFPAIAEHSGVDAGTLRGLRKFRAVTWHIWSAIHATYEALSGTPATSGYHTQTRARAIAKGWPAPLDWEGHDIDDPRTVVVAQPWKPKTAKEIAAERALVVAELTAKGLTAKEVADRVGVTPRQVVRDRGTAGIAAA